MKRALTSLAALSLAAPTFATHQILYKGETPSPQPVEETISAPFYNERFDEFRYFLSDEGERKDGEWDASEELYTATVTNGAYRWSAVYHDPEQEEDDHRPWVTNKIYAILYSLAPEAETPEDGGGTVSASVELDEDVPGNAVVTISADSWPGFEFSHWQRTSPTPQVLPHSVTNHSWEIDENSQTETWVAYFTGVGEPGYTNDLVEISASVDATDGGGSVSGGGKMQKGRTFSIGANDSKDFVFSHWTENGTRLAYGRSFSGTATTDRAFVAHFKPAPRYITCCPSQYYYEETQGGNIAINEAWISSVDGVPYERGTHTVSATRGQRVTITADGKSFSEARVRMASSSLHRSADRDDAWTLTHTFTVHESEDWIVFFGKRDEILRNGDGKILCQGQ